MATRKKSPTSASPTPVNSERANASARKPGPSEEHTAAQQAAFLTALAETGVITYACQAAEVGRTTQWEWRQASAEFRARFDEAMEEARDKIELEAHRRAVDGWEEPVFGLTQEVVECGDGKRKVVSITAEVGRVRKYSDRLLERLLEGNKPEKYNKKRLEHTGKDGEPLTLDPTKMNDEQLHALAEILRSMGGAQ